MIRQTIRPFSAALLVVVLGTSFAQADPAVTSPAHSRHVTPHRRHHPSHLAANTTAPRSAQSAAPALGSSAPAPVPNEALNAPIEDPHPETSVTPSVFQLHYPPQGEGYTTGSSPQAMDDREAARATGVEVKVPLPQ